MSAPVFTENYHDFAQGYSYTSTKGSANCKYIISKLMNNYGFTYEASCGVVGNMVLESGINPNRPEQKYKDNYPYSSNGSYMGGNYGFGLCQWTPWYQKMISGTLVHTNGKTNGSGQNSYYYWFHNVKGYSGSPTRTDDNPIGQIDPQLEYLNEVRWGWLKYSRWGYSYSYTWNQYRALTDAGEAGAAWLAQYERPASILANSTQAKADKTFSNRRAQGQKIYNYFLSIYSGSTAGTGGNNDPDPVEPDEPAEKNDTLIPIPYRHIRNGRVVRNFILMTPDQLSID